jgi:hypothetical protein
MVTGILFAIFLLVCTFGSIICLTLLYYTFPLILLRGRISVNIIKMIFNSCSVKIRLIINQKLSFAIFSTLYITL